jgi:hypothetical protein
MRTCSTCGWWAYSGEHGTWGDCTIARMRCGSPCIGTRETDCPAWRHRCGECGEPAYWQWSLGGISAYYCDECAEGLEVARTSAEETWATED